MTYTYEHFVGVAGATAISARSAAGGAGINLVVEVAGQEANFRQLVRSHGHARCGDSTAALPRSGRLPGDQQVRADGEHRRDGRHARHRRHFLALLAGAGTTASRTAIFLNSAAALGVAPQECLVVEDSIHGIVAARRAGMGSVAVGKLSGDPELAALRQEPEEPACAALASLEDLTWQTCNRLWESARR